MGWASYFESDLEKAHDRAFMAQSFQNPANRPITAAKSPSAAAPITIASTLPSAPSVSRVERCRQMRDVHVLCLAELRPKARPEYHARY
jgi:hypothetical protein